MAGALVIGSLARIAPFEERGFAVRREVVENWQAGDYVVCRVDGPPSGLQQVELTTGRVIDVYEGAAVLGALGAGDIGQHFPPSDPQWRGADSALFLHHAAGLVAGRGGAIRHVDVTLICQAPKIGPHRAAMVTRLATLLELPPDRISVKATTTERLGFTGRGEGIAALATATVAFAAASA